ncbi:MAG: hypothetical protein E7408_01835 [Ruminococcaceae bacterium]|nr:hypothetical protein [Oscillospiraceae bacterium]
MKTKILVLALVLVMIGTCMPTMAAQPTGDNLITNGSFEDGLTGWKLAQGVSGEPALTVSSGTVVTDQKTDGNSAVMLTGTSDERTVLRQFLPAGTLEEGKQYELSAYINIIAGTGARIALREEDTYNGEEVCDLIGTTPSGASSKFSSAATNEWVRLSTVFTCKESTATNGCSFIVDINKSALTLYIDDVQLRETDTGLLADNGEFETFSTDFKLLTYDQHTTWLGRRADQGFPLDMSLVRTEDHGTAICLTGRGSANSTIFVRFDAAKLSALTADTTIKLSYRMKVIKETVSEGDAVNTSIEHRSASPAPGRFANTVTVPGEYFDQWITVEHWFTYRPVADQVYRINAGTHASDTKILFDSFTAKVESAPAVAGGKTISCTEAEVDTTRNNDDGYATTAPTTFVTTRISVDEAYTVGETASLYVHYPTLEETAQSGTVVCAVYSESENNLRTLETVKTADITAIRRGESGTVVDFPLTGITMQDGKTYTLEAMVWDGVSGLRPLAGAAKLVMPIVEAATE